jgi:two-component system chemotaxis response regulator CheY
MTNQPTADGLYSIGVLSKTVGISTDTLRHYAEIGLFKPAHISGETGYRYYTLAQATTLARIMEFKAYGFSLTEIKEILAEDDGTLKNVYQRRYLALLTEKRRLQGVMNKLSEKIKQQQEENVMGKKVLLVDDAPFMRMMCTDILTKNGYEVAGEAADGIGAVEMYKQLKPDVVLMNIVMPNMDGVEALRNIKAFDPAANVVMNSAMSQARIIAEALLAGAHGFNVKPFHPDGLLSLLRDSFDPTREFDRDILQRVYDECTGDYICSQADIDEITQLALSSEADEYAVISLIERLNHHGPVPKTPEHIKPPDLPAEQSAIVLNTLNKIEQGQAAEQSVNILTMLSKIEQGQEDMKALLEKIAEKIV